jgi:hypothetical protein
MADEQDVTFYERIMRKPFPCLGQGVVKLHMHEQQPFAIYISDNQDDKQNIHKKHGIFLVVSRNGTNFCMRASDKKANVILEKIQSPESKLDADHKVTYWVSYDRQRMRVTFGKGYIMKETSLLRYTFVNDGGEHVAKFFSVDKKFYVEVYRYSPPPQPRKCTAFQSSAGKRNRPPTPETEISDHEPSVEFWLQPFVDNPPPRIRDSSNLSIDDIDQGSYTFSASLPPTCRELYTNIKNCQMDPHLVDCIRYNIRTANCTLYKKLESKAEEYGKPNPKETYLRITLGGSDGGSPGVPYVMEIWPSGHYSPVHNHGNSNAVIKVLHGQIHVDIYNKFEGKKPKNASGEAPYKQEKRPKNMLLDGGETQTPLSGFDAKEGEFTWISRNWYQTHKLTNKSDDVCITLQCYKYDKDDVIQWPDFEYLANDTNGVEQFDPTSDFEYMDMVKIVKKEFPLKAGRRKGGKP